MGFERRVEADIDLDAVEYNIKTIQALNPPSRKTLLVIKADAYGHGAVTFAKEFDSISDFYGVAGVDEAMELRGAGITKPILILGYTDRSHYAELIENDIRPAIFSKEDADKQESSRATVSLQGNEVSASRAGEERERSDKGESRASLCSSQAPWGVSLIPSWLHDLGGFSCCSLLLF